jgi:ATP-dependent Lhr-like helicase
MQPYEMQWLDELTLCGDVTWGRLNGPRARTDDSTPFPTLTRVVPISLCVRDDLDWLIDQSTSEHDVEQVSSRAAMVLDLLRGGGAMFFADLVKRSGLLAAEAETVLGELVAAGQITSDGFGALRALIKSPTDKRRVEKMVRRRNGRRRSRAPREAGRWSLLADRDNDAEPVDADERIEAWCRQLLERYGVMFRELLARETSAPGWRDLVRVYRKLEARGEIRGGRFVADVSGEQYALPGAVGALRRLRDEEPDRALIVVSAVDPLNLVGIVTDGPRVPATASNALVYHQGRLVGFHQGGETHITAEASAEMAAALPDRLSGRAAPARVDTGPAVRFDRT